MQTRPDRVRSPRSQRLQFSSVMRGSAVVRKNLKGGSPAEMGIEHVLVMVSHSIFDPKPTGSPDKSHRPFSADYSSTDANFVNYTLRPL